MMTWIPVVLAVLGLVASVLDDRRATRPARDRAKLEEAFHEDVDRTNAAIAAGDAEALAQQFETERREGLTRLVDSNGRLGTVRLHERPADSRQPPA